MTVRYSPGPWHVAVAARGLVVLQQGSSAQLVERVWEQLGAGGGLAAVLDALGAVGASLTALPAFAVALAEGDGIRVAVRGDVALVVSTPAGSQEVSGAGVTTWSERVVPGATAVVFPSPGSADAALPVRDGVVAAGALTWFLAHPSPEPVPVSERVPVPELVEGPERVPVPERVEGPPPTPHESMPVFAAPPPPPAPPAVPGTPPLGEGPAASVDLIDSVPTTLSGRPSTSSATASAAPPKTKSALETVGDHDGSTISVAQARALRAAAHEVDADTAPPPLAPARPPAPGRITLSTGQTVVLDRTVVIGRRPRATRVAATDLPHLVAVDSPQQDISRSHLELRVEGDAILATDLHTTNGTLLVRAGADPVRLHPGEQTIVVGGDLLDLGDGITLVVEESP